MWSKFAVPFTPLHVSYNNIHSSIWDIYSAIFSNDHLHSPVMPLRNQRWLMCTLHQLYKRYVESRILRGWHFNLFYHIFSPVQDPAFQRPFCRPLKLLPNLPPPQKAKQPARRPWSYPRYVFRLMSITISTSSFYCRLVLQKQSQVSKVAGVAGFIAEIQSTLSDEAFQTFKKALGVYKDVSCPNHCSCISGS